MRGGPATTATFGRPALAGRGRSRQHLDGALAGEDRLVPLVLDPDVHPEEALTFVAAADRAGDRERVVDTHRTQEVEALGDPQGPLARQARPDERREKDAPSMPWTTMSLNSVVSA
jgi:hypothetical protein